MARPFYREDPPERQVRTAGKTDWKDTLNVPPEKKYQTLIEFLKKELNPASEKKEEDKPNPAGHAPGNPGVPITVNNVDGEKGWEGLIALWVKNITASFALPFQASKQSGNHICIYAQEAPSGLMPQICAQGPS